MLKYSTSEQAIRKFHSQNAGASFDVFSRGRIKDIGNSYDQLLSCVRGVSQKVLDLGCGDGILIEKIISEGHLGFGVDMSIEELTAAQKRLGTNIPLIHGRAQDLPFENGQFDYVLSHMSLMLMEDIEVVISEIFRVLRSGGQFSAIIVDHQVQNKVSTLFLNKLREKVLQLPNIPSIGDKRVLQKEELKLLFTNWKEIQIQEMKMEINVPLSETWTWLSNAFYPVSWLEDKEREELYQWTMDNIQVLTVDGYMNWVFGIRQIIASRS